MLSWHDIRVRTRDGQAPYITFPAINAVAGAKSEDKSEGVGTKRERPGEEETQREEEVAQVSISHDGEYAIATVLACSTHPGR